MDFNSEETNFLNRLKQILGNVDSMVLAVRFFSEIIYHNDRRSGININFTLPIINQFTERPNVLLLDRYKQNVIFRRSKEFLDSSTLLRKYDIYDIEVNSFISQFYSSLQEFINRLLLESPNFKLYLQFRNELPFDRNIIDSIPNINDPLFNSPVSGSKTPLIYSIVYENIEILDYILEQPGINLNVTDSSGWSALMWAAKICNEGTNAAEKLINAGADVNISSTDGRNFTRLDIMVNERLRANIASEIREGIQVHQVENLGDILYLTRVGVQYNFSALNIADFFYCSHIIESIENKLKISRDEALDKIKVDQLLNKRPFEDSPNICPICRENLDLPGGIDSEYVPDCISITERAKNAFENTDYCVFLPVCGHMVHKSCLLQQIDNDCKNTRKFPPSRCPVCREVLNSLENLSNGLSIDLYGIPYYKEYKVNSIDPQNSPYLTTHENEDVITLRNMEGSNIKVTKDWYKDHLRKSYYRDLFTSTLKFKKCMNVEEKEKQPKRRKLSLDGKRKRKSKTRSRRRKSKTRSRRRVRK